MATLIVFRKSLGSVPGFRGSKLVSQHTADNLHKIQFENGVGCTARFCGTATEVDSSVKTAYMGGLHIKYLKYIHGQWLLVFASYKGWQGLASEQLFSCSSHPWSKDRENTMGLRLHMMESGGGDILAVWREPSDLSNRGAHVQYIGYGQNIQHVREDVGGNYRIANICSDDANNRWMVYYDTTCMKPRGVRPGEWIQHGTSASNLKQKIDAAYVQAREDGRHWYVAILRCNSRHQWVAVLRQGGTKDGWEVTKESIAVLPNDPRGKKLQTQMKLLEAKDKCYKLRHVAFDGVELVMIAQVCDSFSNYEDKLHVVHSVERLRELVHCYLEKGLTVGEHWEVALAADLYVEKESEVDKLKREVQEGLARERVLQTKVAALSAKKSQSACEEDLLEKVRASAKQAVESVAKIDNPIKKKTAKQNLQRMCHPDKNPPAFSWLFNEIMKVVNRDCK